MSTKRLHRPVKVVAPYIVRKSKIAGPDSETIAYWWTLALSERAKLLALTVKLQHTGPRAVIVLTPYITKLKAVGPDSETTAYWTQICKGSGPLHQKEQNHWPWQWNYDLLDQEMLNLWPCTSERAKLLAGLTVKLQPTGPRTVKLVAPYITKLKTVGTASESMARNGPRHWVTASSYTCTVPGCPN